jgi:YggT family protein
MLIFIAAVNILFQIYSLMLLAYILGSWFPQVFQYRIMQFVVFYAEPYLKVFKRIIPPLGMMDFSPIVAFLCLGFIQNIVINLLLHFAK